MKNALALTFLSSMTCLVAWDAEAAPKASPEVHHHHTGIKSTAKAEPTSTHKTNSKKAHAHKKAVAKAEHAKVNPALSGAAKVDVDLPVHEKVAPKATPAPAGKGNAKVSPKGNAKSAAKVEPKAAVVKKGPQRSYWIAAEPHVPLAFVDAGAIHSVGEAGKSCGTESRWAKPKSRWNAIDAWGQLVGTHEIKASELDDATHCRDVSFIPRGKVTSNAQHAVFVSADSTWRPSAKVEWTPSEAEKKEFDRFTGTLSTLWINQKPFGKALPLAKRVMFFEVPAADDKNVHRPTRWAVVGGPILLVAYLGDKDHWKVSTVQAPLGLANSYHPVGVFDMNGDKVPEIIVHSSDGPSAGESVLSLDTDNVSWSDKAVSPGGNTQ